MKQLITPELEECRVAGAPADWNGAYIRKGLTIVVSTGGGWDHVSVSRKTRCPTWDEMCSVKRLCFKPDEAVMQLHPPESDYRNCHPFCLHLWRPQTTSEIATIRREWAQSGEPMPPEYPTESVGQIPLPPGIFVAPESSKKHA